MKVGVCGYVCVFVIGSSPEFTVEVIPREKPDKYHFDSYLWSLKFVIATKSQKERKGTTPQHN